MVLRKEVSMFISRYLSNPNGIPRFESNSVSVNTSNVVFSFTDAGSQFNDNFCGLVLIKVNQSIPSSTTDTLPIFINTTALTTYGGDSVTVSDFKGTGIYLGYYEGKTKSLQIIL